MFIAMGGGGDEEEEEEEGPLPWSDRRSFLLRSSHQQRISATEEQPWGLGFEVLLVLRGAIARYGRRKKKEERRRKKKEERRKKKKKKKKEEGLRDTSEEEDIYSFIKVSFC